MRTRGTHDRTWIPELPHSGLEITKILLSVLVVLVCFGIWAYVLARYGVDVIRRDQWDTPAHQLLLFLDNNLTFGELAAQQHESRKIFPNLISIALTYWRGYYDTWAELYVGYALAIPLIVLVGVLACRSFHRIGDTVVIVAVFTALFWTERTSYYHLWSINFERQLPEIALLLILLCFLSWGTSWGTIAVAIVASIVGQYSFSGGVVLWPLTIFFLLVFAVGDWRDRLLKSGVLLIAAAVSSAFYFHDFHTIQDRNLFEVLNYPLKEALRFVLKFLGNGLSGDTDFASVFGAFALVTFVGMFLRYVMSPPPLNQRIIYGVWFTLGGYVMTQVILATITRLPLSIDHHIDHALRVDFATYLSFLGAAIVALGLLMTAERTRQVVSFAALAVAAVLTLQLTLPGFWDQSRLHKQRYEYAKACLLLSSHYVDLPCMSPLRREFSLSYIERAGPLLGTPVLDELVVSGKGRGYIDELKVRNGRLHGRGWAALRKEEPANAVVAAVETPSGLKILKAAEVAQPRPDVARRVDRALLRSGWSFDVPVEEEVKACDVRIYSIDTATGDLSPLEFSTPSGC